MHIIIYKNNRKECIIIKKLVVFLCCIMTILLCMSGTVLAASVPPQLFPGNDSNPMDYTPPAGYIHYEIPGSGAPGTYTVRVNSSGAIDPNGPFYFTVVVGTAPGESFTKVLSLYSCIGKPLFTCLDSKNKQERYFSFLLIYYIIKPLTNCSLHVQQRKSIDLCKVLFHHLILPFL